MRKPVLATVFTVLFFLLQTSLMPYLRIGPVQGNLLFAWLAVVTVSLDRKYTYCAGAVLGILLECTVSTVPAFYAVLYPAIAMLFAFIFADMSEKKREKLVIADKKKLDDPPALLRIPLCALCSDAVYNTIMITYGYLSGNGFTFGHIARGLATSVYTVFLTLLLMVPLRFALGVRTVIRPKEQEKNFIL